MTASWGGICCSQPPCIAVALRKATCTHGNILARRAFTISIPSEQYVKQADYFGLASGRERGETPAVAGLTAAKGAFVDAPYVDEFPLVLECKLAHVFSAGAAHPVCREIVDVKADESVLGGQAGHQESQAVGVHAGHPGCTTASANSSDRLSPSARSCPIGDDHDGHHRSRCAAILSHRSTLRPDSQGIGRPGRGINTVSAAVAVGRTGSIHGSRPNAQAHTASAKFIPTSSGAWASEPNVMGTPLQTRVGGFRAWINLPAILAQTGGVEFDGATVPLGGGQKTFRRAARNPASGGWPNFFGKSAWPMISNNPVSAACASRSK